MNLSPTGTEVVGLSPPRESRDRPQCRAEMLIPRDDRQCQPKNPEMMIPRDDRQCQPEMMIPHDDSAYHTKGGNRDRWSVVGLGREVGPVAGRRTTTRRTRGRRWGVGSMTSWYDHQRIIKEPPPRPTTTGRAFLRTANHGPPTSSTEEVVGGDLGTAPAGRGISRRQMMRICSAFSWRICWRTPLGTNLSRTLSLCLHTTGAQYIVLALHVVFEGKRKRWWYQSLMVS